MSEHIYTPRISLRDIAKKLNLSHSTVSLALRNHPRISEPVRKKIHETAEEMGYHPDPMLAALAHYRQGKAEPQIHAVVAWINTWPKPEKLRSFHEFDLYWKGAMACAEKFGYRLEEFACGPLCSPKRLETILRTRNISGILIPPQPVSPDWADFAWKDFSAVRFGRSCVYPAVQVVTADQMANTLLAFRKTRERGYKRVGFVTHTSSSERGPFFIAGFLMAQFELPEEERLPVLVLENVNFESDSKKLAAWIKKYKPDAILTAAAEMRQMLERIGCRVPGDIGLVVESVLDGNSDTGIYQNPEEIGRVAFLVVMSLINDNARGIPPVFRQSLVLGEWRDGHTLPDRTITASGRVSKKSSRVAATVEI
ncbi:MAG: LacI family DNA-binding transcriptional regulator [Chthoniobacteraceae bacterium]